MAGCTPKSSNCGTTPKASAHTSENLARVCGPASNTPTTLKAGPLVSRPAMAANAEPQLWEFEGQEPLLVSTCTSVSWQPQSHGSRTT